LFRDDCDGDHSSKQKHRKNKSYGFSLIELIFVIGIVGILVAITLSCVHNYLETVRCEVCIMKCLQVEEMYEAWLVFTNQEHTNNTFTEYVNENFGEICPKGGDITYRREKVKCTIHHIDQDDEDDDSVPYL
jgi:prepilin-type N-terminal cleavage/methylation domain-containing protein